MCEADTVLVPPCQAGYETRLPHLDDHSILPLRKCSLLHSWVEVIPPPGSEDGDSGVDFGCCKAVLPLWQEHFEDNGRPQRHRTQHRIWRGYGTMLVAQRCSIAAEMLTSDDNFSLSDPAGANSQHAASQCTVQ